MFAGVFVVGMDLHRELVVGEDEFHKQRNARRPCDAGAGPFGGKAGQASPSVRPASGPVANAQLVAGQPDFADRLVAAGGAVEKGRQAARAPDARHEDGRQARRRERSRGGCCRGEEVLQAPQSFFDALDGGGVGESQKAGRAEGVAGHHGDVFAFEQLLRQRRGIARAVDQARGDIRERVERARRVPGR